MGDRTNCSLLLGKQPSQQLAERLTEISDMGEFPYYLFEGVNYGEINRASEGLREALKAELIPYAWFWGSGDEYNDGVELYAGIAGEDETTHDTDTEGNIVLTVPQIEDQEQLNHARKWHAFLNELREKAFEENTQ